MCHILNDVELVDLFIYYDMCDFHLNSITQNLNVGKYEASQLWKKHPR